jgi:quinol monooxygenase YgiN
MAPGGVTHVAGIYEGGLRVIDLWEDMAHFARFRDEEIGPHTQAAITFHVNGPYEGGWCVIDGWTSKAARDEFMEAHIRPVFESVPLTGEPTIEDLLVEATLLHAAAVTT